MTGPGVVRTVLGDLAPADLGRTNYHEHLFHASPLLPGDDLDDPELSRRETELLRDSGFDAIVDLTPIGLGRNPHGVVEIARATGVHVVAATGVHRHQHYPSDHPVHDWDEEAMLECFVTELVSGFRPDPFGRGDLLDARAGVIKVGVGYWQITAFEERVLAAAGEAHRRTGAPVVCHTELGTATWEAAELLERHGMSRDKLVLAHVDRNPDPGLHTELADSGVYLGYDGAARAKYWPDSVLVDCLVSVAERGGRDRLLLGGDVARRSSFAAYGGMPGMAYLGDRFVPRVREAGGDELVDAVLVTNPARLLAFTPPDGAAAHAPA